MATQSTLKRASAIVVAALTALSLSGCFGTPTAPDDAIVSENGDLRLSSWTLMRGERLTLNAIAENTGDDKLPIRLGCGQPWTSRIVAPDGSNVSYVEVQERVGCGWEWDDLRPNGHLEFLHSWDFRGHNVDTDEEWTMPGGNYTWVLRVSLRDDVTFAETVIPIVVPCSELNPCTVDE